MADISSNNREILDLIDRALFCLAFSDTTSGTHEQVRQHDWSFCFSRNCLTIVCISSVCLLVSLSMHLFIFRCICPSVFHLSISFLQNVHQGVCGDPCNFWFDKCVSLFFNADGTFGNNVEVIDWIPDKKPLQL